MKDTTIQTCFPFSHISSMHPLPLISCLSSTHLPHSISSISLTNSTSLPLTPTSSPLICILGIHSLAHLTSLFTLYLPSLSTYSLLDLLSPTSFILALNVHHTNFTLFTHHPGPLLITSPSTLPLCSTSYSPLSPFQISLPLLFLISPIHPSTLAYFIIHTHCSLTFPFPPVCSPPHYP